MRVVGNIVEWFIKIMHMHKLYTEVISVLPEPSSVPTTALSGNLPCAYRILQRMKRAKFLMTQGLKLPDFEYSCQYKESAGFHILVARSAWRNCLELWYKYSFHHFVLRRLQFLNLISKVSLGIIAPSLAVPRTNIDL